METGNGTFFAKVPVGHHVTVTWRALRRKFLARGCPRIVGIHPSCLAKEPVFTLLWGTVTEPQSEKGKVQNGRIRRT